MTLSYTYPDGTGSSEVGGFNNAAELAVQPLRGRLEGVMGSMAAVSRQMPMKSPHPPWTSLLFNELQRVLGESHFTPEWHEVIDDDGRLRERHVLAFEADWFPTYGVQLPSAREKPIHNYFTSHHLGSDFMEVYPWTTEGPDKVLVASFELAERLWAQRDSRATENPVTFDTAVKGLITRTTEAAAGAILAFWDEVKDYRCSCYGFTPCDFKEGQRDPNCDLVPTATLPPGTGFPRRHRWCCHHHCHHSAESTVVV